MSETLRDNLNRLSNATIVFMLKNGFPLNSGFEETLAPMVMEQLFIYYAEKDKVFDLLEDRIEEEAIKFAFARVQETTDMVQASVRMMTGGGLN